MSACVVQTCWAHRREGWVWIGKQAGWAGLDGDEAWGGNVTRGMKDKWVGHSLKEWKSTVSVPGTFLGKTNNRQVLLLPLFEWGTFCNVGFNAEVWCGLRAFWGLMAQNKKPLIFIKPNIYFFSLRVTNNLSQKVCMWGEHWFPKLFSCGTCSRVWLRSSSTNGVLFGQKKILTFSKIFFELISNKNIYLAVCLFPFSQLGF